MLTTSTSLKGCWFGKVCLTYISSPSCGMFGHVSSVHSLDSVYSNALLKPIRIYREAYAHTSRIVNIFLEHISGWSTFLSNYQIFLSQSKSSILHERILLLMMQKSLPENKTSTYAQPRKVTCIQFKKSFSMTLHVPFSRFSLQILS